MPFSQENYFIYFLKTLLQFSTQMSRFILFKPKLEKKCAYKNFLSSRHNLGLVGYIVKEDIDITVIQISSREEFSIRKNSSSEKQGYVFQCKGKNLNLYEQTSWRKKYSCVSVSLYSAQLTTIVKPIILFEVLCSAYINFLANKTKQ